MGPGRSSAAASSTDPGCGPSGGQRLIESIRADNVAWKSFSLSRDSNGNPKITVISNSPCAPTNMCGESLPNR